MYTGTTLDRANYFHRYCHSSMTHDESYSTAPKSISLSPSFLVLATSEYYK